MQFSFRRSNVIIRRERKVPRPPDPSVPWLGPRRGESGGRLVPFFLSLGLHLTLVTGVFLENYLRPPLELQMVSVDQLLQDDRYEITWPVRPTDLPPVKPAETPKAAPPAGDGAPPRFRLPQQVVANDPNAHSSRQMIWDEAPRVELNRDVASPNFVEPPRLEVERPRFELAEAKLLAPPRQAIASETAPRLQAAAPVSPDVLARNPRLRYWTPETEAVAPQRSSLAAGAAPVIVSGPLGGLDLDQIQQRARLRFWTPEQEAVEPGRQALAPAGSAPRIVSGPVGGIDVAQFQRLSRLRYQQADGTAGPGPAPEQRALAEDAGGAPDIAAAAGGSPAAGANDVMLGQTLASLGDLSPPGTGRAVVGVDPTQDPAAAVPRGQRGGNFSAGPDGGAKGSGSPGTGSGDAAAGDNGALAAVRIPHLSVTPASPGAAPGLSDGRPPEPGAPDADRESVLRQFRNADFSPIPNVGVAARREKPDPEFPFPGRAVYTLAVNMPNISSYSGSWIMEFAEVKKPDAVEGRLQPPSPRLKVDPVYPPAAIEERIEGDVVLHAVIRSDGLVDHIQVIKRLDGRLDESAKAALSKWRFNPATKNGVPVDIETVVRIPFRLTPRGDNRR